MKGLNFLLPLFAALLFGSCQKEQITIGPDAHDTFYVEEDGAALHVLVRGNTASKTFMLIVHGGPGSSAYIYNTPKMHEIVGSEFATVFYDQRDAGASQGNQNAAVYPLAQYADDLRDVITVLKYRYGQDINIFLWSKSFGGMVASQFMTTSGNQNLVKGWLYVDASHNYGLNDSLTYQMLLQYGQDHLDRNVNAEKWEPIMKYCKANPPGPFTFDQSLQLNLYGWQAQRIVEGLEPYKFDVIQKTLISENIPLTNYYLGKTNAAERAFNQSLIPIKFTARLHKVTVPVLVCFGKLDFVCPQGLGDDFLAHVGSSDKTKVIMEKSAHHLEEQDAYYHAFADWIRAHI